MQKSIIIALVFILGAGLACQNDPKNEQQTDAATKRSSKQTSIDPWVIDSEESARQAAVGVWTNSEPLNTMVQMVVGWNKYEFHADGTFEHYRAQPSDDDWDNPEKGRWKVFSDKYINTGKRYYGIDWENYRPLIFVDAQTVQLIDTDGSLLTTLRKGDVFPFSN